MAAGGLIGASSEWAARQAVADNSYRHDAFGPGLDGVSAWRTAARQKFMTGIAVPELQPFRAAAVASIQSGPVCVVDGIRIEELTWQLPHGPPTRAVLLRPTTFCEGDQPLPAVLALHCHGGDKHFGVEKITITDRPQHSLMEAHQRVFYEGKAWANECARRGFVVLAHDVFPFGSRKVGRAAVPSSLCTPGAASATLHPVPLRELLVAEAAARVSSAEATGSAAAETAHIEAYNWFAFAPSRAVHHPERHCAILTHIKEAPPSLIRLHHRLPPFTMPSPRRSPLGLCG